MRGYHSLQCGDEELYLYSLFHRHGSVHRERLLVSTACAVLYLAFTSTSEGHHL